VPDEPTAQATRRFPIRIGPRSRPLLLLFGVRERNSYVDLTADSIDAHFGFYRLRAPLDNIAQWRIEGPWLWITAIGVRRGIRDGALSFDGNHRGGVRVEFKVPVKWGFLHPPRLYVTVADLEGLGGALAAAGIPGEDARRSTT
jgi:hypothetical protein